jgi:ABC-type nitrate/sulfonate/bicarbonate transport system permease component
MTRQARLGWNVLGIVTALAVWELAGAAAGSGLLAPPSEVAADYGALLAAGMPAMLLAALVQMAAGYALAMAVGVPLGIAMGRSRVADLALHPWVSMLVVTSTAALVPLFILTFGTGAGFVTALAFMASAFYITLTVYQGARGVEPRMTAVAQSFCASRAQTFRMVLLPALFPYIVTGARVGLIHAIRATVMAQMFVIVGFGGLIAQSGLEISTAGLLGLLATIAAVSMVLNALLDRAGRWIAPWYQTNAG